MHCRARIHRSLPQAVVAAALTLSGAGIATAEPAAGVDASVPTSEQQAQWTPEQVLATLKAGNARFVAGDLTTRDHSAEIRQAVSGQYPKGIVLSCVDSRVPVEDVFDRSIGDIFVARVAGNFENTDILGSMEFATAVAGSKLVLVLGHESCGAIKSAIDGVELGNITAMLNNIRPAVEQASEGYSGEMTSQNADFVHRVSEANVRMTMDDIRRRSEVIRKLEAEGKIAIVGALYDMDSGRVEILD